MKGGRGRRLVCILIVAAGLGATSAAIAAIAANAPSPAPPAAKKPAWPANVRLIEARLGKEAFSTSFSLDLPQFRFYNAEGWRLAHTAGYSGQFAAFLQSLLAGKGTPDGNLLADDLPRFETVDGRRLTEVPPADYTIVEYWADWCTPCHKQTADMVKVLARHPKLEVNVVYVESVPPGGPTKD